MEYEITTLQEFNNIFYTHLINKSELFIWQNALQSRGLNKSGHYYWFNFTIEPSLLSDICIILWTRLKGKTLIVFD